MAYRKENMPKSEKIILVRPCMICKKNRIVWSNTHGAQCRECYEARREEE